MLRASSELSGERVDLGVVNRGDSAGGVDHGDRLLAFADAVLLGDDETLGRERSALRAVLSPEAFVDACAVIGAFNVVDRIADATGIPLDAPLAIMTTDLQRELDLGRFASAANTPAAP
jgi:alkylhydroperoxidase family enzyme